MHYMVQYALHERFWYMSALWADVSTDRREWLTTEWKLILFLEVFLFMNPNLALEIFGYIGTGVVLISFIMKDIKWLRVVNMAGGLISLIYAILTNAMPVVVLNGSLILINGVQLMRIIRAEREKKETDKHIIDRENEKDEEKI